MSSWGSTGFPRRGRRRRPTTAPSTYEILSAVADAAQDRVSREEEEDEDEKVQAEVIEIGLQAAGRALKIRKDDYMAIAAKSQLLREKAELTRDEGERRALLIEVGKLRERSAELRHSLEATRPEKISGNPAELTETARKAGITGVVIISAVIDEEGNVVDARVVKGLPMGLDQKALEAVRTWKFKPATAFGKPVRVSYTMTVSFQ